MLKRLAVAAAMAAVLVPPPLTGADAASSAQYVNTDGSQSPAVVRLCPDPSNPGKTIPCPADATIGATTDTPSQSTVLGFLEGLWAIFNTNAPATAANQTAVQSAPGTPQTKAVTVQGNASGVALPVAVGAYVWTPLGCYQITSLGSAAGLPTIPSGTKLVSISVESQAVRMRDDGTAPTSTVGLLLPVGGPWPYSGTLTAIEFIQTAASATIDYCTYR